MADYLTEQAVKNIWCSPDQNKQVIVQPKKISGFGGVFNNVPVMWRNYSTPTPNTRFHIYQIGGVTPDYLGLSDPSNKGMWVLIASACNAQNLIVDLYSDKGIQLPRSYSWYLVTEDNNLIVAVQDQPMINIDLNTEDLYIRFYSNAYFNSSRWDSSTGGGITVQGLITSVTDDILALQSAFIAFQASSSGKAYAFVNGLLVDQIDLVSSTPGDVIEFVYDNSIHRVVDIPLANLSSFVSTLDAASKYILHPPKEATTDPNYSNIDFKDNVDVFLYQLSYPDTSSTRFEGIYYHKNRPYSVRQVTHKDYSIPVGYINSFLTSLTEWTSGSNFIVRLQIRNSGLALPLIYESNLINELYKLTDTQIYNAMIGLNSLVPNWTVNNLESAAYPKIMGGCINEITPALAQTAYGYNSISQLLAYTPTFTSSSTGLTQASLIENLQNNSTVYEYDIDGKLLGWYLNTTNTTYTCTNSATKLIEVITGSGALVLDEIYGTQTSTLDPTLDYRMYLCNLIDGLPNNNWVDVTGSNNYAIVGNTLTWLTNSATQYTMLRSNKDFLAYDTSVYLQNGVLTFSLVSEQNRTGTALNTVLQVPLGELELFLNGYNLIEGTDYIINGAVVVIINKSFLVNPDTDAQLITVRFCGFCTSGLVHEDTENDRGFVTQGILSNNNKFDIRDDKVLHISVGGAVYDRSQLSFAQTNAGIAVPGIPDGTPYIVRDIVVPLRRTTNADTYAMRAVALATDTSVANYMSNTFPEPTFSTPDSIVSLYKVYSPIVSSILHDLTNGILVNPLIYGNYNDNQLQTICASYVWLLAFDPTLSPNAVDSNFVIVDPSYSDAVTSIDIFQYRFLLNVIRFYLKKAVSITTYVQATAIQAPT